MEIKSNFEDFEISETDAKKFIRFVMMTPYCDLYFHVLNYHTTYYEILSTEHLMQIYQKHPQEIRIDVPCMYTGICRLKNCKEYSQIVSYRDIWFDKHKFEMFLKKHPELKSDESLQQNAALKNEKQDGDLKEKERNSLYKMIAGMVYARYKYKPTDNKSPTPKDISDDVFRKTGEKIDPDTVRKWLKKITDRYPKSDQI